MPTLTDYGRRLQKECCNIRRCPLVVLDRSSGEQRRTLPINYADRRHTRNMLIKYKKIYTHQKLLKDLSEIKAVLDVEAQLIKALVKMALARQALGLQLSF